MENCRDTREDRLYPSHLDAAPRATPHDHGRAGGFADACARLLPERAFTRLVSFCLARLAVRPFYPVLVDALLDAVCRVGTTQGGKMSGLNQGICHTHDVAAALVDQARRGLAPDKPVASEDLPFAIQPAQLLTPSRQPATTLTPGGATLIVTLQGADWRRALAFLPPRQAAYWLDLGRALQGRLLDGLTRLDRIRFRAFNGYPQHEAVRAHVEGTVEMLAALLPPLASSLASRHRTALANQLMTEADRFVLQVVDCVTHATKLEPSHILLLEGDQPADHVVAGLIEAGIPESRIAIACGSPNLAGQAAFERRRTGEMTQPLHDRATAWEALEKSLTIARRHLAPLRVKGRSLVMAATNARHLPAATATMAALARHWPVTFLVPDVTVNPPALKTALRLFLATSGRVRAAFIPSYQTFPALADKPIWARFLTNALTARHAGIPLARATDFGVEAFIDQYLLPALALAEQFETAFRQAPPAHVVLVPGTQPVGMLAAGAANAASIPTAQIQTLLTQPNGREYRPVAGIVGVIDTSQAALFSRYFGVSATNMLLTGYVDASPSAGTASAAVTAMPEAASSRHMVAFVSQPLPEIAGKALAMLAAALAVRPGVSAVVYSHPREAPEQITDFAALIARAGLGDRLRHVTGGTPWADIVRADLVACLYSNLGIQAATMGKDVLVIDPTVEGFPCRFEEMGIALRATSSHDLGVILDDLIADGMRRATLATRRRAYFDSNPQLLLCDGLDKIVARLREQ